MLRDGAKTWLTTHMVVARVDGRDYGPVRVLLWRRYARPADLVRLPDGDVFVILERATDTVLQRLDEAGRAWAVLDGRYSLPALARRRDSPVQPDPVAARRPPDALAELALLVEALPGATHAELADALGVTRARVTQMLSSVPAGPAVPPGPTAGHVTRWWSAARPWEQAQAVYEWLDANACVPVLGGETAADAIAPWRAPASAVVHARKIVPPPAGFVPADSHETATVTVVVDYRPSVIAGARDVDTPVGVLRVAHPLHVAADLHDAAALDERAAEQVDMLVRRAGALHGTPTGGYGRLPAHQQEGFGHGRTDHAELGL